jgi:hypothetical protein
VTFVTSPSSASKMIATLSPAGFEVAVEAVVRDVQLAVGNHLKNGARIRRATG